MRNISGSELGLMSALGVVFIVLKLVGVIDWSWWWVLAPLWAPYAVAFAFLVFAFVGTGLAVIFSGRR